MTDVRTVLRAGPMSGFQLAVVAVCVAVNAIDGFDVLAAAFVAPSIAKAWGVEPRTLGLLLSSGPVGMALGALFVAPFADVWGRRAVVILGVVTMGGGMVLSAAAADLTQLALLRVLTGVGIGGALASANTLVAEYASDRRRALCVSLMAGGYPIGATLGGLVAAHLLNAYDWRAVFLFGGGLSLVLLPLILVFLPESMDFLLTRRTPSALTRANALLRRLRQPQLDALPPAPSTGAKRVVGVFSGALLPGTALICLSYFMVMLTLYFLLQWTPKVLVDAGLSVKGGISGGALMNLGGIAGSFGFGVLTAWATPRRLAPSVMLASFVLVAIFAFAPIDLDVLLPLGFAVGISIFGAITSLYAVVPLIYPPGVRATGTGMAIGFGRIGAIIGPILAGVLISAGWQRWQFTLALAAPLLIAAVLAARIPLWRESSPE